MRFCPLWTGSKGGMLRRSSPNCQPVRARSLVAMTPVADECRVGCTGCGDSGTAPCTGPTGGTWYLFRDTLLMLLHGEALPYKALVGKSESKRTEEGHR
jgi:hypothetical protein